MSHGFTKSFVDSSGLGSLMRLWSDGTWGCRHLKCLKRWLGLEDSVPRWHTPRAGIFVLEVIGLSSLLHPSFLEAIWRSLKHISWLLPDQVIQKKRKEEATASFMSWPQKSHPAFSVISYWVRMGHPLQCGRGPQHGVQDRRMGNRGLAHRLPTTSD